MKIIFSVLIFCVCSVKILAQVAVPVIQWQNTIGGSTGDGLNSMQKTSDGGYILGGVSDSNVSGDKTENCLGNTDYWVVKINETGNIQWQNTIGGSGTDELTCIKQTADDGYILVGKSNSNISGDKTENSNGDYDFWVVKIDSIGIIQWQNTIGGSGSDGPTELQIANEGGYIIGGNSNSNISGDKSENSINNSTDFWIIKINSIGNIQWQNTIGGNGSDYLVSTQKTLDGGYILGGTSSSNISADKTGNSINNTYDYWVVKINSIGNIQWQNTIGGNNTEEIVSVKQTVDGGYIVGGWSKSNISGDKTENNNGIGGQYDSDYWILKLNSNGNILWQNTIGGTEGDYFSFLQILNDGSFLLGGNSGSPASGDKTENNNGPSMTYDYWILKLDSIGNIYWQNTIGANFQEQLTYLDKSNDGGYIVGGYSNSDISGDKTEDSNGDYDIWIVKLTPDIICTNCHKPTNLTSLSISNTKEKLMWNIQPCAITYQIRYRVVGTGAWSNIFSFGNVGYRTLNNLIPNSSYQFQVRTICQQNPLVNSLYTIMQTFTTPLRQEEQNVATDNCNQFSIFPNPATNKIEISCVTDDVSEIRIFNLLGQLMLRFDNPLMADGIALDISDLPSGMYLLTMTSESKTVSEKFVKE